MLKLHSNKNVIATTDSGNSIRLARVTKDTNLPTVLRKGKALIVSSVNGNDYLGYDLVFSKDSQDIGHKNVQYLEPELHYLDNDDVIRVDTDRNSVRAIYRVNATANFLFVTEQCNSYCLMCSQPPRDINDSHLIKELIQAVPLIPKYAREIGITGGEPTLMGQDFLVLLRTLRSHLPNSSLHVLTNGRTFADFDLARSVASIKHADLMFGIPLYSDAPHLLSLIHI